MTIKLATTNKHLSLNIKNPEEIESFLKNEKTIDAILEVWYFDCAFTLESRKGTVWETSRADIRYPSSKPYRDILDDVIRQQLEPFMEQREKRVFVSFGEYFPNHKCCETIKDEEGRAVGGKDNYVARGQFKVKPLPGEPSPPQIKLQQQP